MTPELSSVARDDPERAWYRWRAQNPHFAIDPRFAFAAGVRHGRRSMLSDSARWVALEPLLAEVLVELRLARLERDAEFDDMGVGADLTGVDDSETGEHVVPGVQAVASPSPQPVPEPDLTVGSSDAQVGN